MKQRFNHRPRYQKIAIICSFIYLLFVLSLGLLIPFIATKQAPKSLSEMLGRQVTIENIKVNPFTFELSLSQLTVNEQDSQKAFFHLDNVEVDFMFWQSLFNLNISLDYLTVDGTTLSLERLAILANQTDTSMPSGYQFNFTDIINTFDQRAKALAKTNPSEDDNKQTEIETDVEKEQDTQPIAIHLNRFNFNNAALQINDKLTETQLLYPRINVSATMVKTDALLSQSPDANKINLTISDDKNGQIKLDTQAQLFPLDAKGKLAITQMELTQYWSLVEDLFKVSLQSANLNLISSFAATETAIEAVTDSPIVDFNITDTDITLSNIVANDDQRQVTTVDLLALEGITVSSQEQNIDIKQFRTSDANFWLTVAPEKVNLIELFTPIFVNTQQESSHKAANLETNTEATQSTNQSTDQSTDNDSVDDQASLQASVQEPSDLGSSTTESKPEWLVTLHQLNVENYQFELTESVANKTANFWKLSNINFTTQTIKSDLSLPIEYQLDLSINDQSQFSSTGVFDAKLISLEADIDYQKVNLTKLQPYISPFMNITLESGLFNTKGHISANTKQKFVYQGQASVNQLQIKDNLLKQPLLNWESMIITDLAFDNLGQSLTIDEVLFDSLFSRLIIAEDRSTNIADLIVTPAGKDNNESTTPTTATNATTAPVVADSDNQGSSRLPENQQISQQSDFAIDIKRIGFKDSSAFFADNSLTPNFASGIEQLNGEITQISTNPQTRASVNLEGKIDKYAPVTLKGDINPLLANPYLDLNLAFNKVELTSINPYSGTYAGYYIDKGQLSLALNYQLENNQLVGSNHLVIDQLELGKPSNSSLATSLPITLAIALLQDRHGVIDLGVDVDGDLDSPSFSFGSIVMTAITNVITKAITAPFSLLAGLVGGDEDSMDKVSFEFGQSAITQEQQTTLTSLAKALDDRPLLILNIKGSVDLANDQLALQQEQLHQKLANQAGIEVTALPTDLSASQYPQQGPLVDALIALYQTETQLDPLLIEQKITEENPQIEALELQTRWHIALYNFSLNQQAVSEAQLGILAQQRAKTIKTYLVEQANIDPSRVFILESRVHFEQTDAQAILTLDAN
ncbi:MULTISPECIES: DUF748 domain-containing protein [unclassified Shewanella]|uniref:DUF748 domain-containing protein n=1 Tax=unclassified Shewanella TaxID=196818 RepID=UPI0035518C90